MKTKYNADYFDKKKYKTIIYFVYIHFVLKLSVWVCYEISILRVLVKQLSCK